MGFLYEATTFLSKSNCPMDHECKARFYPAIKTRESDKCVRTAKETHLILQEILLDSSKSTIC
jgi:hypothetical protein